MMQVYLANQELWAGQQLLPGYAAKKVLLLEYKGCYVSDLPEDIQEPILNTHREWNVENCDWYEWVYEVFYTTMLKLGIDTKVREHKWTDKKGVKHLNYKIAVYFSGFCSQGDGACFECQTDDTDKLFDAMIKADVVPKRIRLQAAYSEHYRNLLIEDINVSTQRSGHYYHSRCMDVSFSVDTEDIPAPMLSYEEFKDWEDNVKSWLRGLADDLYKSLEAEYDGQTTNEAVREALDANEFKYWWTGQPIDDEFEAEWDAVEQEYVI